MSFDEYALHLAQKYRVAISIAILKTKPENIGIDEYLDQIKNVIIEKNMQGELNISACSDDFNIDSSDDVNDLNDLNYTQNRPSHDVINDIDESDNVLNQTQGNDDGIHMNDNWTQDNGNKTEDINISTPNNDYRIEDNNNGTEDNNVYITADNDNTFKDNSKIDLNYSIKIQNNFKETYKKVNVNKEKKDKFREVIQVLKGVDVTTTDKVLINDIHNQTCENIQNKPFDFMGMDQTQCYSDNDNTFFESIERLTNENRPTRHEPDYCQKNIENRQCEKKSQQFQIEGNVNQVNSNITSQEDIRKRKKLEINDALDVWKPKLSKMIHSVKNNTIYPTEANINSNLAKIPIAQNTSLQATRTEGQNKAGIQVNMEVIDRKETHTVDTQCDTHYSESQADAIIIENKLIYGSNINNAIQEQGKNTNIANVFSQNSQEIFNKSQNDEAANVTKEIDTTSTIHIQNDGTQTNVRIENDIAFSQNAPMMDSLNSTLKLKLTTVNSEKNVDHLKNDGLDTLFDNNLVNNTSNDKCCTVFDKTTEKTDDFINTDANLNESDEDLTDDQIEKIPFKIIEEMNQIKMYLNKRKEIKDSGFFGSSQSKCSLKSTQSANVGESANTVFDYLSSCPLVSATQDLTEQISEVLGQLIDRLHEEETYPPFLEELINTVQNLLKLVYEEENYDFDVLLKKDEQIQRIVLLSKSIHITKFTIEKINSILQKLLDEISADDTMYEIQNINKIENICYIFHILQVILPKYNSNSQTSTHNSQEDEKVLRKRDISDIWRKKWISNFKEESNEGGLENKCVLKDCSAILNKIIVNFMDGYSLIAFSALKCFNLMQ